MSNSREAPWRRCALLALLWFGTACESTLADGQDGGPVATDGGETNTGVGTSSSGSTGGSGSTSATSAASTTSGGSSKSSSGNTSTTYGAGSSSSGGSSEGSSGSSRGSSNASSGSSSGGGSTGAGSSSSGGSSGGYPAIGIAWTASRPFPAFASATSFDVVSSLPSSSDDQLCALSLQGVVNRQQPRIWLPGSNMSLWLGQLPSSITQNPVSNWMTLLTKYQSEIAGLVIYDDTVSDTTFTPAENPTINLATTIAGIENGVVVSPTLATTLGAAPYNFPTLVDLRTNSFTTAAASAGQSVTDYVYSYELSNYVTNGQASNRILIGLQSSIANSLRDYAVATQAAVIWLDPQATTTDLPILDQYLATLQPDSPYMGWWTQEQAGVSAGSKYGVPTFAANHAQNLSALTGVHVPITPTSPPAAPALANKVYVAMFVSDGDNVEENENLIPTAAKWGDPARGQVPITWTLQPAMVDLAPLILAYFWNTATPDDALSSGPSGVGYTYPQDWTAILFDGYTSASAPYLQEAGLRMITVWNDGAPLGGTQYATAYATQMPNLLGLTQEVLPTSGPNPSIIDDASGTPSLPLLGLTVSYGADASALESGIQTAVNGWKKTSPLFLAVQGDNNETAITPTELRTVAQSFADAGVEFVRGDTLFQLIRMQNGLPPDP